MTTPEATPETSLARAGGGMARNMLVVSAGSVVSQALGVLTTPLIARLFAPDSFGVAGVFSSIVGILAILASLRYDRAITLPKHDSDAANLLVLCLGLNVLVSLLCTLVWFCLPPAAWAWLNAPELGDQTLLFGAALLLAALTIPLVTWAQRLGQFARVSVGRIVASLSTTVASLALGYAGFGSGTALASSRTWGGQLAQPLALAVGSGRVEVGFVLRSVSWQGLRQNAKRYSEFPLYSLPAAVLDVLGRESPALLFATLYGAEAAGLYALSSRLMRIPADLVSGAMGEVLFAQASAARAAGEPLTELITVSSKRLLAAAVWPMLAMGAVAPLVFGDLFGQSWSEAGRYTFVLTPGVLSIFVSSPMTVLLTVLEAHRLNLVSQTVLSVCYIVPTLLGAALGLDALPTLALFSLTICFANLWRLVQLWQLAAVSVGVQLRHLLLHGLFALPSLGAMWLSDQLGWHHAISAALLLLGAIPYAWLAVRVDPGLRDVAAGIVAGALRRVRGLRRQART